MTTATFTWTGTTVSFPLTTGLYNDASYSLSYAPIQSRSGPTEAQIADYEQRMAERERIQRERYAQRHAAENRARELLTAHMSEQQYGDYMANQHFFVTAKSGRRWRIRCHHYQGNVDLMEPSADLIMATYCAHGVDTLPHSDHYLIQKIVLETNDEDFIRVANLISHYYPTERLARQALPQSDAA